MPELALPGIRESVNLYDALSALLIPLIPDRKLSNPSERLLSTCVDTVGAEPPLRPGLERGYRDETDFGL